MSLLGGFAKSDGKAARFAGSFQSESGAFCPKRFLRVNTDPRKLRFFVVGKSPFIPRDITNNGTSKQATLARNTLAIVSTVPILFLTHSDPWKDANLPAQAL
ncbi:MAG: hypothetical protein NT168_01850 [Planctomycetota bacterium]|nr:hypothetical protein [Planctomycetota bacterium]